MPKVKLAITSIQGFPGNYKVNVSGSDFQPNAEILWRLKGEDTFIDDNIISPRGGGFVGPDGTFGFEANAIGGNLNEDWGGDEIYADVYYANLGGAHYKSNTVKGDF